ncbi:MAG: hypothetical protein EB143_03755 [Actinobacteria bacterium]|nr:hypothetical protein [Actinomycetota bacterium]
MVTASQHETERDECHGGDEMIAIDARKLATVQCRRKCKHTKDKDPESAVYPTTQCSRNHECPEEIQQLGSSHGCQPKRLDQHEKQGVTDAFRKCEIPLAPDPRISEEFKAEPLTRHDVACDYDLQLRIVAATPHDVHRHDGTQDNTGNSNREIGPPTTHRHGCASTCVGGVV